jgi:hypothetical protein
MACPTGPEPDARTSRVTEADVRAWVRSYVWRGEYDPDEVVILIQDNLDAPDEFEEDWIRGLVRREVAAKRKAEKTWPKVTDYDRLDRAFEALEARGVIALHVAGYTQSDGLSDVTEVYHENGGKKSNYAGHCFYTEQDQEGAREGSGMHIGFGHLTGDDAKGVEVGKLVREELERAGLKVVWDGTIGRRLYLKDFRWQRRG